MKKKDRLFPQAAAAGLIGTMLQAMSLFSPLSSVSIVFTAIPFFTSLYLAFTNYNILSAPKWVGLDNFKRDVLGG